MNLDTLHISVRIWFFSFLTLSVGAFIFCVFSNNEFAFALAIPFLICSAIGSIPAWLLLHLILPIIKNKKTSLNTKNQWFLLGLFSICGIYGLVGAFINGNSIDDISTLQVFLLVTLVLFACSSISFLIIQRDVETYFSIVELEIYTESIEEKEAEILTSLDSSTALNNNSLNKTIITMQDSQQSIIEVEPTQPSNKIMIKAIVTGVLILIMLIPTAFISNLVSEREQRQKQVVAEVSDKWANAQTITGPYIVVPYKDTFVSADNKTRTTTSNIILLPENLEMNGDVVAEQRPRSIYKVLLYKSSLRANGIFKVKIPENIIPANLLLNNARLCIGINDFKGVDGPITMNFNGQSIEMNPGLPTKQIDENGLSAPITLTLDQLQSAIPFNCSLRIKGSRQLNFVPLAGNSKFSLQSAWNNPSFDGNVLPSERTVTDKGFNANWQFNKANLPFGTFIRDFNFQKASFAFGVTMLEPADQYAKTMRSVKYAILFIGLTFSLFFIVELMQKKPFHPVQYILVGIALVVFYTLLLSISEYIDFNIAYLISSLATVLLIVLYTKSHFLNWKTASLFGLVLSSLYTFTFVLIQLEDTSLLVGSIGLFIVLAIAMYASRKVNWYNTAVPTSPTETTENK